MNGYLILVILVGDGIQDTLAQRIFWERWSLNPLESLVRDHIVYILGGQEVESAAYLL